MPENSDFPSRKWRLLLSIAAGISVTVITILAQWASTGAYYSQPVVTTGFALSAAHDHIEQYRNNHGKLPDGFAELGDPSEFGHYDGWNHPLVYQPNGQSYDLYSFGRDGQPGGVGLDADIHYSGGAFYPQTHATLHQFLFEIPDTLVLTRGSILAGIITFLIAWTPTLRRKKPLSWTSLILRVLITFILCWLIAGFMATLDIPSGH